MVHQWLALWLGRLSMKSQRFIRDFSRIPRPRYAFPPKSPKASMAIPLTMETINVLALSCSTSSLNMMVMCLLALASDPQNDDSGIHLPLQALVKSRCFFLHHRDIVMGSTRMYTARRNHPTIIKGGRLSELSASGKHLQVWSMKSLFTGHSSCHKHC